MTKPNLCVNGRLLSLEKPAVMAILNATPDSFFGGSRQNTLEQALAAASQMLKDGALILDVGGYSTRPNAADVSPTEEIDRVCPLIEGILKQNPEAIVSVDTFRAATAEAAIRAGAHLINDVSGGEIDPDIWQVAAKYQCPYVLMHSRGTPQTMMQLTDYKHLVADIFDYFTQKIQALRAQGVHELILDLGFGFAKTEVQNYELMREMAVFQSFKLPILVGISRKSMIYKPLKLTADQALNGTTSLHMLCMERGANILRVHDVREAVQSIQLRELFWNKSL
ncbi:MAG: dihydropteroate synthase [Cytophagales bacterium]|nr:MAG: dihydropteroate synthase [Cytophagales bacterium]TAF60293.1 MAG: dihydropteroate synthase [Cytophagales bacterium]